MADRRSPVREPGGPGDASGPPQLDVRAVTIEYPTEQGLFTAVQDVSFAVREGEKFILLGPSGCGKSTLLKAVAGFMAPARGAVELEGRAVTRPGPDRVVVFQEFDQLLPWKTVLGNVTYPLRVARRMAGPAARAQAERFLRLVGLEGFADAYPHQLSGGMKQRVAIARSLAIEPRMLLMDEPFASLDALTRRKMQEELLAIWEATRKTILFVTHSIQEAVLLGDRILILSPGPGRVRRILDNAAAGQRETEASIRVQAELQALLEA
jgi:NitT/TauT family transport system ATP-binding protein